jgi:hypothetical protein
LGLAAATKGTAVELIASTAFDSYLIEFTASGYGASATPSRGCLDILVGAATEEVIAGGGNETSTIFSIDGNELMGNPVMNLPVFSDIPAGQRLTVRLSRSSAADTVATWNCALHGVVG